jgi:hypothetical protein
MRKALNWVLGMVLALLTGQAFGQEPGATLEDLSRQAQALKPSPEDLKWQRIPWVIDDLTEGLRLAREEKRPLFVVTAYGHPLERC